MTNYGMKVSRPGYPVDSAADNQLLWSSAFPMPVIIMNGTLADGATLTHNLGYTPIVMFLYQGASYTEFFANNVFFNTTQLINNSGQTIRYYIINRDIRTNLSGKNINLTLATQLATNQDYGFKASQDGQDVKTAGLSGLVSFSGFSLAGIPVRHLIIHQSGFEDNISTGTLKTYAHNLGYVPMAFAFVRQHGTSNWQMIFLTFFVDSGTGVTSIIYKVGLSGSNITVANDLGYAIDFAYVIFKDPF